MARKKVQDYSTAELHSKANTLKAIVYVMVGVLIVYAATMFYLMATGSWDTESPAIAIPFLLMVVAFVIINLRNSLIVELKRREESGESV